MELNRIMRTGIALMCVAFLMVSCVTTKKVAYLQDMQHETQISLEDKFEAVISPYDELDILVSSFDKELAMPFNMGTVTKDANAGSNANNGLAYLVDQNGDIQFPVLGTIHVEGLTRLKLQEKVRELLVNGGYISDPFVMVRFRNFKVFFLGANGGKAITVPNERCTFLEALALSGDMTVQTDRSKVAVLREVDGKMVMRYLDPRSSKVFSDPFYMLQQNDFIITRNSGYGNFMQSFSQWTPFFTMFTTIFSSVTSIFSIYLSFRMLEVYSR